MPASTEADPFELEGVGGLRLAGDRRGDPEAPAVVFLHGGGQTRHSWAGAASTVAGGGWQAITLDGRGHGDSGWSPTGDYLLSTFAADVTIVLRHLPPRPVLVGASLGGLTSLLVAGELEPDAVAGVVLVDVIPGFEQEGADRIQAFMVEHAADGFASLDEVADAIAAYNPQRPRPTDLGGLHKNVRLRDGRWYWHWDPNFIGGIGDLPPDEEAFDVPRLEQAVAAILEAGTPMLLVRGKASDIVSEAGASDFVARFPDIELVDISGAGHMVVGDRNDAFTGAVLDFLDRRVKA